MVVLKISVVVNPDNRREFLQMVESGIIDIRKENGCLSCNFCQNIENDNTFWCLEEWLSAKKAGEHFRSDTFSALLGGMEILGEIEDFKLIGASTINNMKTLRSEASRLD